jgi:hypothetical protein
MSLDRTILLEQRLRLTRVFMVTSASSGRTNRLFHRKSIATIDAIEHVLNVANPYLAYRDCQIYLCNLEVSGFHLKHIPICTCRICSLTALMAL